MPTNEERKEFINKRLGNLNFNYSEEEMAKIIEKTDHCSYADLQSIIRSFLLLSIKHSKQKQNEEKNNSNEISFHIDDLIEVISSHASRFTTTYPLSLYEQFSTATETK